MKKNVLVLIVLLSIVFIFLLRPKEQSKELVFWTLQLSNYSKYFNSLILEYEKLHPEVKIKWIDIPYSEGEKRTLAAILSENPPDLINLNPDFSIMLDKKNALTRFSDNDLKQFSQQISALLKNGNNYFGIPFYATTSILYINNDLTKKSRIYDVPKTYDDMYKLSKQVKSYTGKYVTMPTIAENDTMIKILNKYDVNSSTKINSKKSLEIFEQYRNLYQDGFIPKETLTQGHREALEKFMSGEIAYLVTGSNFLNIIKENAPNIYKNIDVSYQLTGTNNRYDCSLMNFIIPKKSKNTQQALDFALYITNYENQLRFAKLTGVLPVNSYTLKNKYFEDYIDDSLETKSRIISSQQLKFLIKPFEYGPKQKDEIWKINEITQKTLLNKYSIEELLKKF